MVVIILVLKIVDLQKGLISRMGWRIVERVWIGDRIQRHILKTMVEFIMVWNIVRQKYRRREWVRIVVLHHGVMLNENWWLGL